MIWIGWITLVTLVLYLGTGIWVSRVRVRDKVYAPAMTGTPAFERAARVHSNNLEQMVPFLVALWLCAWAWAPLPAAVCGVVWLFARALYAFSYYGDPKRRGPGFGLSVLALVALIIGAGFGLLRLAVVLG
jgi:glutathione S-transferase